MQTNGVFENRHNRCISFAHLMGRGQKKTKRADDILFNELS